MSPTITHLDVASEARPSPSEPGAVVSREVQRARSGDHWFAGVTTCSQVTSRRAPLARERGRHRYRRGALWHARGQCVAVLVHVSAR